MNQYRSVLEVLKFADSKSMLTSTAISSTWSKAASSEELYRDKCEAEIFGLNSQVSYSSPKIMYQSYLRTQTQIVSVTNSTIRYFFCKRQRWDKPVHLKRKIKPECQSAWTLLPDGNIFSCGGRKQFIDSYFSEVYLLMSGGEVIELTSMNESKAYHKCIFFKNAVYVFGGNGPNWKPSWNEKLEISTWPISRNVSWKRLPDMLGSSSAVRPCGYGDCIYLVGKCKVEMFHCEDETYTLLNLSFPLTDSNCAVVHNGEILLLERDNIQDYRITKWNLKTNLVTSIKRVEQQGPPFNPKATVASIVVNNCLFVFDLDSRIRMIDLDTGKLTPYKLQ